MTYFSKISFCVHQLWTIVWFSICRFAGMPTRSIVSKIRFSKATIKVTPLLGYVFILHNIHHFFFRNLQFLTHRIETKRFHVSIISTPKQHIWKMIVTTTSIPLICYLNTTIAHWPIYSHKKQYSITKSNMQVFLTHFKSHSNE